MASERTAAGDSRAGADHVDDPRVWEGGYESAQEADRARDTAELLSGFPPSSVVLEVGAGSGLVTEAIRGRGFFVVAMDISPTPLQRLSGARLVGDATRIPVATGAVDVVVAAEVLEHFPPQLQDAVLTEIERVARHGVVITVPYKEQLSAGVARCAACGHSFHAWRHFVSFNRRSAGHLLGPPFAVARAEVLGPPRPWVPRLAVALAQAFDGFYRPPPGFARCPACSETERFVSRTGLLVRLLRGAVPRVLPKRKGLWIGLVFDRGSRPEGRSRP